MLHALALAATPPPVTIDSILGEMADVKGPGAMVRLWSANPVGTLRFYFDGEAKPRLVRDMKALLTGKDPMFPEPYAYVAARGCNLFYPMLYAKGLKVTWKGPPDAAIYYAVGTREYAPGTKAVTDVPGTGTKPLVARTAQALFPPTPHAPLAGGPILAGGILEAKFDSRSGARPSRSRVFQSLLAAGHRRKSKGTRTGRPRHQGLGPN